MKVVRNSDEAFQLRNKMIGEPHGWVQWKGTDVCMDVYCECGHHSHIDAEFAYYVKCPECGAVYACSGEIEFIKLEEEPGFSVITGE